MRQSPGAILRKVRLNKGLTQLEFSKLLSMNAHHLCMVENEQRPVSLAVARRLIAIEPSLSFTDLL